MLPLYIEEFLSIFIGEKLIGKEIDRFDIKLSDGSLSKLIKHQKVIISGTKKTVLSLKVSSFDFYKSSFNSVYFTQTPVVPSGSGLLKIKEMKNYSSIFIDFFPEIINECFLWKITTHEKSLIFYGKS